MSDNNFKIGDSVVYPAHGVGKILDIEEQTIGGILISLYVISFIKEKMTLKVPVNRAAASGLRQLCTSEDMTKVIKILQGKAKTSRGMWSRRAQEYETKINSGQIIAIAEVVRDLFKNTEDPERSYSERMIYECALSRLAGEIAALKNIEYKDATEELLELLKEKSVA